MSIYVGNLSYSAKEEDLEQVFAEYGKVKRITLPTDREPVASVDLPLSNLKKKPTRTKRLKR